MKYLLLVLFAGCVANPTTPQSENQHNLNGYWYVNGMQTWHWIQNGNTITGSAYFDQFDSSTINCQIKGDSLQGMIITFTSQGFQPIGVNAKIQNDSSLIGTWYETIPFNAFRLR